jgi:hypothetical protein
MVGILVPKFRVAQTQGMSVRADGERNLGVGGRSAAKSLIGGEKVEEEVGEGGVKV